MNQLIFATFILVHSALSAPPNFTWRTCDNSVDPIVINHLMVTQNPVSTILQIKGEGSLTTNITAPVKGTVRVEKKMFWGWTKMPCILDVGTCSYADVCSLVSKKNTCPKEFQDQNLPCKCPVTQGKYGGVLTLSLKDALLPTWMEKGSYRVKATLQSNSQRLMCLQFQIKIK